MEDTGGTDDKIILRARESETIKSLKDKIHAKKGFDPDNQRLIFKDNILKDELTISSCNIQNGATLYLGLKTRGKYNTML